MSNAQICRPIRLILDGFLQRNTPGTIKTSAPRSRITVDRSLLVPVVPAASVLPDPPADDTGIPVQENTLSSLVGEDVFDHPRLRVTASAVELDDDVPLHLLEGSAMHDGRLSEIDHGELESWRADDEALSGVSVSESTYEEFLSVVEAG